MTWSIFINICYKYRILNKDNFRALLNFSLFFEGRLRNITPYCQLNYLYGILNFKTITKMQNILS